jgi:hypothetical protein
MAWRVSFPGKKPKSPNSKIYNDVARKNIKKYSIAPPSEPAVMAPEIAAKKGGHMAIPVKNPTKGANLFAEGSIFNFLHHVEWGKLLNKPNKTREIPMTNDVGPDSPFSFSAPNVCPKNPDSNPINR